MSLAPSIHATAVVSPDAELGEGVEIGPYAVVEGGAVVGNGTKIDAHAIIRGATTLGEHCRIHPCAVLGDDPQDLSFDFARTRLVVGDHTVVREHATVHRSTKEGRPTVIGSHVLLMGMSHVAHDCVIGDRVVICNSGLVAGHCEIGPRAFISGNTVVHQFCRVGALVMLSGLSGVGRDVGPFLTVAGRSRIQGVNAVGMRRAGMTAAQRSRVKQAYRLLFGVPDLARGLDLVREAHGGHPEIGEILAFYAASRRGYSRPGGGWSGVEAEPGAPDL